MSLENFNPNDVGVDNGNYFGLPYTPEEANILMVSIPWDVTTSYKPGTANGPEAILAASTQLDMFDFDVNDAWKIGHGTVPMDESIKERSVKYRAIAAQVIEHLENGGELSDIEIQENLREVNTACEQLKQEVKSTCASWLEKGKKIALVGGEHSVPLGYLEALAERHTQFGILQIDAHADLRDAYEGFTYSHASIMYNALKIKQVTKLVQVGIRDICQDEVDLARRDSRISLFDDYSLKYNSFEGLTWAEQCQRIIQTLPEKVYISFDIDGLTPEHSPNTGTPVAGGLTFHQAIYLFKKLVESGREIIGCDVNEVAPDAHSEWDANVGARVLFKLTNLMALSTPRP